MVKRLDGRTHEQVRPFYAQYGSYGYADATVLFQLGNTKVLCAVTLQQGVPPFLKGRGTGWLTAEYAMLPTATQIRTHREASTMKRNDRSIEISRIIGRSLRTMVKLDALGERSIYVDCDVLQADGSTRVAAITGASLALHRAAQLWVEKGVFKSSVVTEPVVALSAGAAGDDVLLDLTFTEDSSIDADFNFIINAAGKVIEVQGTAEKQPIAWGQIQRMHELIVQASQPLFALFAPDGTQTLSDKNQEFRKKESIPLFSLKNRFVPHDNRS